MPPPRLLTDLMEDTIAEILLRLPPDETEHLFRAALVCKPWLRILCDPGFLRRYRAFHGTPPLPGLLRVHESRDIEIVPFPGFVPTTSMRAFPEPPASDGCLMRLLDCRHSRRLLHIMESRDWDVVDLDSDVENQTGAGYLLAWDPVAGDSHVLPNPNTGSIGLDYTAVVFCATEGCDHLDCHGGPFRVAFVSTDTDSVVACMFSSETGAWSAPTCGSRDSANVSGILARSGAIIGDEVYFTLSKTTATVYAMCVTFVQSTAILKYDWRKNCLSLIDPPPHPEVCNGSRAFMMTEDGSLGLAVIVDSSLCICSRKVNADGSAEWVRRSVVVDLEKVIPTVKPCDDYGSRIVGFVEGAGVIILNTNVGLFTIELKSRRVKMIGKPEFDYSVLPYMSFYTPDRGTLSSLASSLMSDVRLKSKCKTLRNE